MSKPMKKKKKVNRNQFPLTISLQPFEYRILNPGDSLTIGNTALEWDGKKLSIKPALDFWRYSSV